MVTPKKNVSASERIYTHTKIGCDITSYTIRMQWNKHLGDTMARVISKIITKKTCLSVRHNTTSKRATTAPTDCVAIRLRICAQRVRQRGVVLDLWVDSRGAARHHHYHLMMEEEAGEVAKQAETAAST